MVLFLSTGCRELPYIWKSDMPPVLFLEMIYTEIMKLTTWGREPYLRS
jgi:hypothetical protein